MKRWDIINHLIKKNGYKRYLEIGLWEGECFKLIECESKTSVDPDPRWSPTHKITSDQFFGFYVQEPYDMIFIDGDHDHGQPEKDLANAMNCLTESGSIVMHDCSCDAVGGHWEIQTIAPVLMAFNCTENGWKCHTIDTDNGCAIIQRGQQEKHNPLFRDIVNWKNRNLYNFKPELMNYISVHKFWEIYG
jgi:hypothetical protein